MTLDPVRSCYTKARFGSEKDVLAKIARIIRRDGVRLYYYGCESCGGWHLTRTPQERDYK